MSFIIFTALIEIALMIKLSVIEEYFKNIEFTDDHLQLDECTTVTNIQKFYEEHLSILKQNTGDKRYMPFYYRLLKLYKIYTSTE